MPAHQHICFQQRNPFNVKNHKTTHIKTQAKYQPKGLCKFGDHCLGTICPRDLLLAKPAQVFLSMPTWKHGHAQKRPTPLLTLGLGSTRKQKNLMTFCSMLWAGANSQKFGVICGIKCGNSQHIRVLQMTPQFLNPSVAEQNIST